MKPRPRTLVLADDCNPNWPSLPVVGFNTVRALAEHADVTLATHVRNREALEAAQLPGVDVHYIDNEYVASPLFRLGKWIRGGTDVGWTTNIALNYPTYLAFEWEVWRKFERQLRAGRFDVVHRLTPMSPTLPSFMASRSPVPFVLGPVNGGLKWPRSFDEEREREKEWLVKLRGAHRLLPYYESTFSRSSAVLAAFVHTVLDLPESARHRVINVPEVGIDPELFRAAEVPRSGKRAKFLFAGRLVPYKLPDLVVECFARSPLLRQHEVTIVGSGPEREPMERAIAAATLGDCVKLVGQKTQAEVGQMMRESDVFVFPSIRELGAGVVAEAMASGLCCVAVDYGGPAELLARGRGLKVGPGSRELLTQGFVKHLERVACDLDLARQMGSKAREYALANLSWNVKAERIVEVYRWVMGERRERPEGYGPGVADLAAAA